MIPFGRMRAIAATVLSLSVLSAGCFPHNAKKRTIAQLGEGGFIVGGIVILAVSNTSADCDVKAKAGEDTSACKDRATLISNIGFGLLLAGLVGFIATVTTAEDDSDNGPPKPDPSLTPLTPLTPPPVGPPGSTIATDPPAEPAPTTP